MRLCFKSHGLAPLTRKSIPLPARMFRFTVYETSVISPTGSLRPASLRIMLGNTTQLQTNLRRRRSAMVFAGPVEEIPAAGAALEVPTAGVPT